MAQYDMTIIGGGSGGLTAARTAAALGANVLLLDRQRLGGRLPETMAVSPARVCCM